MMGQEDVKKVEEGVSSVDTAPPPVPVDLAKDVADEKSVIPPAPVEKADDEKSLAVVKKVTEPPIEKTSSASSDRDATLARLESDKKVSLIKAWEENEKAKADNKAVKMMSTISAWENSKKAAIEADLKKMEEALENKKAEYAEKKKNKIAIIHKEAEERRAMVEAKRGEELLKAEEMAAKYRVTGLSPKKLLGCF